MERSASEPAGQAYLQITKPRSNNRRYKLLWPTNGGNDAWQHGWAADPMCSSGPRFTMGREGLQSDTSLRSAKGGTHKDRHTWIQAYVREKTWVPGPGNYKTEREFKRKETEDELDTNNTVQEAAPEFSFGKEIKETHMTLKELQPRKNNGSYPKTEERYTPGPGSYTQYGTIGCPSGGSRQAWVGGKPLATFDFIQKNPVAIGKSAKPDPKTVKAWPRNEDGTLRKPRAMKPHEAEYNRLLAASQQGSLPPLLQERTAELKHMLGIKDA